VKLRSENKGRKLAIGGYPQELKDNASIINTTYVIQQVPSRINFFLDIGMLIKYLK
jgi:hypothetical protein